MKRKKFNFSWKFEPNVATRRNLHKMTGQRVHVNVKDHASMHSGEASPTFWSCMLRNLKLFL